MNPTHQPPPGNPHQATRTRIAKQFLLGICATIGCILFVLFSMRLAPPAQAQATPTPTPTPDCSHTPTPSQTPTATPIIDCGNCQVQAYPSITPTITPIPSPYQPTDLRSTVLQWRIYTPNPTPTEALPGVILVHGGGFHGSSPFEGTMQGPAQDIADAGYYVVSIDYELAPCSLIHNQICHRPSADPDGHSGRPPEQTDAVENAVRALRADTTHCNGKVGVVGGSAGGSHAIFVSINKTPTPGGVWPHWFANGHDDRPDCAVGLSGAYDLSDRTPENYGTYTDPLPMFTANVENYTNSHDLAYQKSVSPVALTIDPDDFKPLLLINSQYDQMPYHQIVDMVCALESAGVSEDDYQAITVPDTDDHSWATWDDWDHIERLGPELTIGSDVISFLDAHLK
jgi:acetyl esterase/lipase